jgi:hypothetical protein
VPNCSISIVSHRQAQLVESLLADIQQYCANDSVEIILTINVEEPLQFDTSVYAFPVQVIRNQSPRGFGANHNAALRSATGDFFCVLNPDIRLTNNPLPALMTCACQVNIGLVAPCVVNKEGSREDSARKFPSVFEIVKKVFGGKSVLHDGATQPISNPDWVAGMFMLFPKKVFQEIGGFDERFFLYYEDVDLCARLTLAGYRTLLCSTVSVVHDARRSSHKKLRYALVHFASMVRFFSSSVYRQVCRKSVES